jgi:hypothetical protein
MLQSNSIAIGDIFALFGAPMIESWLASNSLSVQKGDRCNMQNPSVGERRQ